MPSTEHDQVVALLRATALPDGQIESLEASRAALDGLAQLMPLDDDITVQVVESGPVPVERIEAPGVDPTGAMLYLHGGAYTRGSVTSHRSLCARLSRAAATPVSSVGYRLAPEHPHPAAVDDAVAAYRWLSGDENALAPNRIVIAGDSAGGGLAAATLLALRDADERSPAGAVLISPWLDLTLSGRSMTTKAGEDPMLSRASLQRSAEMYAGGVDPASPLVSPVFADLSGLPPMLVLVGTAELLLDDADRFVATARAEGVDVDLDVEDGLIHVWPIFVGVPEADAAVTRIGEWTRARISAGG